MAEVNLQLGNLLNLVFGIMNLLERRKERGLEREDIASYGDFSRALSQAQNLLSSGGGKLLAGEAVPSPNLPLPGVPGGITGQVARGLPPLVSAPDINDPEEIYRAYTKLQSVIKQPEVPLFRSERLSPALTERAEERQAKLAPLETTEEQILGPLKLKSQREKEIASELGKGLDKEFMGLLQYASPEERQAVLNLRKQGDLFGPEGTTLFGEFQRRQSEDIQKKKLEVKRTKAPGEPKEKEPKPPRSLSSTESAEIMGLDPDFIEPGSPEAKLIDRHRLKYEELASQYPHLGKYTLGKKALKEVLKEEAPPPPSIPTKEGKGEKEEEEPGVPGFQKFPGMRPKNGPLEKIKEDLAETEEAIKKRYGFTK